MKPVTSYTLRNISWGEPVRRVLEAVLRAVEPAAAIRRFVQREGDFLVVGGQAYDLARFRRVLVVGAGKAGAPMTQAVTGLLGDRLEGGIVIVKEGHTSQPTTNGQVDPIRPVILGYGACKRQVVILEAGHPIPDERGVQGSRRIAELLEGASEDDLVISLISGGGSALLVSPAVDIKLSDLQELTKLLLACGATINEINTLRKHLERLKGGGLARLAMPATLVTLILSDVIGDPLDVIASGPTVADPTTYQEALQILKRYDIMKRTPPAIVTHLRNGLRGGLPETPKESDPAFERVQNLVVGSNLQAAQAAQAQAEAEGFQTRLLTTALQGEARLVGCELASLARQVASGRHLIGRPTCLVAGGETTVILRGDGLGGRNQELALGAVEELAGLIDVVLVALATDGGDGPTDAAGAVVTGQTLERANQAGLEPGDFLRRNDAYHFFLKLGDLILTGPTQTNVNDLAFIFVL